MKNAPSFQAQGESLSAASVKSKSISEVKNYL